MKYIHCDDPVLCCTKCGKIDCLRDWLCDKCSYGNKEEHIMNSFGLIWMSEEDFVKFHFLKNVNTKIKYTSKLEL